jgi:hypothetical protein
MKCRFGSTVPRKPIGDMPPRAELTNRLGSKAATAAGVTRETMGPLFIVGLPRSGTKLLRGLLNRHPEIGIPTRESHFIPQLVARFGTEPDLGRPERCKAFYSSLTETTFFRQMKAEGRVLERSRLSREADLTSWASIFEVLFRYYAPDGKEDGFVWGDKTPEYVLKMRDLKTLFPRARFLHILRDPRDCCLSVNKTWNRNVFRAAHVWQEGVLSAGRQSSALGNDYLEIRYEALLNDVRGVMQDVCTWLGVEFSTTMERLQQPAEFYGDARGKTSILTTNQQKYRTQMTRRQIRRIEEIAYEAMKSTGYACEYAMGERPLGRLAQGTLAIGDAVASARFHVGDKGFTRGVRYFIDLHRESQH